MGKQCCTPAFSYSARSSGLPRSLTITSVNRSRRERSLSFWKRKEKEALAESEEEVQRDRLTRRAASEDFDIERVGERVSGRGKERKGKDETDENQKEGLDKRV